MRADRLFSIVLLLQSHRQLTSRDLAGRLEVSARTIHRDMEALSGAGVPVVAERGTGGGWSLMGEYRTNLTGLNEAEIQSLFVSKPSRLLADLNLEKAAEGAFLKLLAALPSVYRRGAEHARQRIYVDVTGWNRAEEAVPLLHALQEAVWQERRVRMVYGRGECDAALERTVDPLGLVAKGSVWYFVAGTDGGAEVRSYRVSRVQGVEILDEQSVRPADFDLAAFWENSSAQFRAHLPEYRARVRVRREIVARMPYAGRFARIERVGEPDAAGWVEVALRFDVEEMACEYALGFGTQLEVLEPLALRARVLAAAQNVVAFYTRDASR
ncbi:MAG TPA: YafY family protein [Pyrinomonadaceae bacterium]|jgi:predicted DNA-binding transcriptional regulator YafY|nr:YafY family protein [Pyrinomonadaceae bacterium]